MSKLAKGVTEQEYAQLKADIEAVLRKKKEDGIIFAAGLFRYKNKLFIYMEHILEEKVDETGLIQEKNIGSLPEMEKKKADVTKLAQEWLGRSAYLSEWPGFYEKNNWVYMYPVFWSDEPKDLESWKRQVAPEKGCGRIAILKPDKLFSYVCHHQALVQEGLLVGDRFQFISLYDNVLFSYFESPRDNERVNIRRSKETSVEIERWKEVVPKEHFIHFEEANGQDFLIIDTEIWIRPE